MAFVALVVAACSSQPAAPPDLLTPGHVHWPEEYGDPVRYTIYGSEQTSDRINIVLIPDGYVYAEKNTMIAHAEALVNFFRTKTPYKEHDPFINYILVFAYSTDSKLGYMFIGVGVGAYAAGISHLITHAFFKALMFLGAGAVMHAL